MKTRLATYGVLLLGLIPALALAADRLGATWPEETPAQAGLSEKRLEGAWRVLEQNQTTTFLVIRSDHVVFERYAPGFSRTKPHYTASLAKALVGGVSLITAMSDGRIAPTDLASRYIPSWRDDPVKRTITIAQLVTHTSGLDDANDDKVVHRDLRGWKGDFWKFLPPPRDPFTLSRDEVPVVFPPGTRELYSNPGIAMLGYCLTASLRGSQTPDLGSLLRDRVLRRIGVPDTEWSVGYSGTVNVDGLPLIGNWGGANFSPNAAARVGRLLLRRGDWDEDQVWPAAVVTTATQWAGLPNFAGLGWWVNRRPEGGKVCAQLPPDAFWGLGAGGQLLLVVPSLDLIVVRNGSGLPAGVDVQRAMERLVFNPVMDAFERPSTPPYPPSPVLSGIEWDSPSSIVRLAPGSDNFPSAWCDDDSLLVAYGDGNGFTPLTPEKLSLGFARVTGTPPTITGSNLRTVTGEQHGDGRQGRKASGLTMIDGTLYLLARNAGNAQLAWSTDRGATWQWSDWKFTESFGCPAFVSFGRNGVGARDEFVYVVSPDAPTAYTRADRLVLARVPRTRLREASAYVYFVRRAQDGSAIWSKEISQRGGIFENAGACYRSHITYHPGLKRYLLTTIGRGTDTRYAGGFAIFDAPEPWGPWTTVFHTDTWDVGPGESNHFPAKWFDADGLGGWLLFSGDDGFSVRHARFVPIAEAK